MNQNYSELLKNPKWQKKRLQIMKRDKFACKLCGDSETQLHVHHLEYNGKSPWEYDNKLLLTVCEDCHGLISYIKKTEMSDSIIKILKYKDTGKILFVTKCENGIRLFEKYNNTYSYNIGFTTETINAINNFAQNG